MAKKLDIKAGDRFGKLTIIRELEHKVTPSGNTYRQFLCKCDCGRMVEKNTLQLHRTPYCVYCKHDNPYIKSLDGEIWADIVGYEGLYQVSTMGRVKSLIKETNIGNRNKVHPEKLLKPAIGKRGYYVVGLSKDNKSVTKTLHRLIATAFIPNPNNKPYIDHIDTNKLNCSISNLRWATAQENSNNPITLERNRQNTKGMWQRGIYNNSERRTFIRVAQYGRDGSFIREWDSIVEVERTIGIDGSSISAVCLGKRKTAGGYSWKHIGKRYSPRNNND